MTSLKTKSICFLAAFLFLSIVPTLARVVNEVKDCDQFFLLHNNQRISPNIPGVLEKGAIIPDQNHPNRYKVICQTYENVPRFLTVYDTVNRIPVFSAYEYRGSVEGRPRGTWKIEPQLEDNMMKESSSCTNQAMGIDYEQDKTYNRGHLFPNGHASSVEEQSSTFTLTNAVPQSKIFNSGKWGVKEEGIKNIMNQHRKDPIRCFVVVGAQHSQVYLNDPKKNPNIDPKKNLRMVNIPSMMWSAFYCTDKTSGAFWGNNEDAGVVTEGTLKDFQKNDWAKDIDPFPGT